MKWQKLIYSHAWNNPKTYKIYETTIFKTRMNDIELSKMVNKSGLSEFAPVTSLRQFLGCGPGKRNLGKTWQVLWDDLWIGKTKSEFTGQNANKDKTTWRKNSRDSQGVPDVYPAE